MSQAGQINSAAGPVPPDVPTTFHTQNGDATPAANIINFYADQTINNNDVGIDNNGAGNTVTYVLTNRNTGTLTTTDGSTNTILSLPLIGGAGTFYVWGSCQAFNAATPASANVSFTGCFRTDGVTATEISVEYNNDWSEAALITSDVVLNVTGNSARIQVTGVNPLTIVWNAILEYRRT